MITPDTIRHWEKEFQEKRKGPIKITRLSYLAGKINLHVELSKKARNQYTRGIK